MGTNYYLYERVCEHCGRGDQEPLHIGKSSFGWCFSLHIMPNAGINDLPDWQARWNGKDVLIKNECDERISPDEMLRIITERSHAPSSEMTPAWLSSNYAVPGPNNLARHALGKGCQGHGAGTWDLITGEFS